jgi:hypothetical protein
MYYQSELRKNHIKSLNKFISMYKFTPNPVNYVLEIAFDIEYRRNDAIPPNVGNNPVANPFELMPNDLYINLINDFKDRIINGVIINNNLININFIQINNSPYFYSRFSSDNNFIDRDFNSCNLFIKTICKILNRKWSNSIQYENMLYNNGNIQNVKIEFILSRVI